LKQSEGVAVEGFQKNALGTAIPVSVLADPPDSGRRLTCLYPLPSAQPAWRPRLSFQPTCVCTHVVSAHTLLLNRIILRFHNISVRGCL